jgi:hypothetical protein
MITGQDRRDLAAEQTSIPAAAPAPVVAATEPPSMNALLFFRGNHNQHYVDSWRGPYVLLPAPVETPHFIGSILDEREIFTYEIAWRAGGPGSLVRRQGRFISEAGARGAAQWEMDRLEKLLAEPEARRP